MKPAQRDLAIEYYRDAKRQRIDRRRGIAERLGITMNALGIRASRIRMTLETCMNAKLQGAMKDFPVGRPHPRERPAQDGTCRCRDDIARDDQYLVRYPLGLLPDDEAERLDEAAIVTTSSRSASRNVEEDLVDAYVAGTLDWDTLQRFGGDLSRLAAAAGEGQVRRALPQRHRSNAVVHGCRQGDDRRGQGAGGGDASAVRGPTRSDAAARLTAAGDGWLAAAALVILSVSALLSRKCGSTVD